MNPVILTSIYPKKEDITSACVNSWRGKYEVYSLNTEEEIKDLKVWYPFVNFIVATKTAYRLFKKHYVSIEEFYQLGKALGRDVIIINSDIFLTEKIKFRNTWFRKGIAAGSRWDYKNSIQRARVLETGFDYFYIPYKYIDVLEDMQMYYMGQCWWDYVVLMRAIKKKISIYHLTDRIAFHWVHEIRYDVVSRKFMANVVMVNEGIDEFMSVEGHGLNLYCLNKIQSNLIEI